MFVSIWFDHIIVDVTSFLQTKVFNPQLNLEIQTENVSGWYLETFSQKNCTFSQGCYAISFKAKVILDWNELEISKVHTHWYLDSSKNDVVWPSIWQKVNFAF